MEYDHDRFRHALHGRAWFAIVASTAYSLSIRHSESRIDSRSALGCNSPHRISADRVAIPAARRHDAAPLAGGAAEDLALAVRAKISSSYDLSDSEAFAAGLPLEPKAAPQAHMQTLVHDFHRRQRQASLLVAGCVAASFVLTVIGIAALARFAKPSPVDAEPITKAASSVDWRQPQEAAVPMLIAASFTEPTPVAEHEPSPSPEPAAAVLSAGSTTPQLVVLYQGQTLELAPLLSQRQARYVLV